MVREKKGERNAEHKKGARRTVCTPAFSISRCLQSFPAFFIAASAAALPLTEEEEEEKEEKGLGAGRAGGGTGGGGGGGASTSPSPGREASARPPPGVLWALAYEARLRLPPPPPPAASGAEKVPKSTEALRASGPRAKVEIPALTAASLESSRVVLCCWYKRPPPPLPALAGAAVAVAVAEAAGAAEAEAGAPGGAAAARAGGDEAEPGGGAIPCLLRIEYRAKVPPFPWSLARRTMSVYLIKSKSVRAQKMTETAPRTSFFGGGSLNLLKVTSRV